MPIPLWLIDVAPPVDLKPPGWAQKKSFAEVRPEDRTKACSEIPWMIRADPAANQIWETVHHGRGFCKTTGDLLRSVRNPHRKGARDWLDSTPYPTTPEKMDEHLERLAAAMQGEKELFWYDAPEGKHLHAEYWEKTGEERVWVFVAAGPEGPADEEIEELVREQVERIELDRWRSRKHRVPREREVRPVARRQR